MHLLRSLLTFALWLSLLAPQATSAKSIRELWTTIPSSLVPLVDSLHRLEMLDYVAMRLPTDVPNALGDSARVDSLTSHGLRVRLSSALTLELQRLPWEGADSVVLLIRTFSGPAAESELRLYDQRWQRLPPEVEREALREVGNLRSPEQLLQRPDSLTEQEWRRLQTLLTPVLVRAEWRDPDGLLLQRSLPVEAVEQRQLLRAITPAVTLRWTGKAFTM